MLYEQVKKLCNEKDIKITALARRLNLSPSAPNNWKEGSLPKVETIMKIAEYFGVTTDYLLYGETKNAGNSASNISNAVVTQDVSSGYISISNGAGADKNPSPELSETMAELMRIFQTLDLRGRNSVLHAAYAEEERMNKGGQFGQ